MSPRLRRLHRGLAVAAVASLVLRWLLSDSFGPSRWNLYLPPLLLVPCALLAVATVPLGRRTRLALVLVTVVFGVLALHSDQPLLFRATVAQAASATATDRSVRVMVFNVEGLERGGEGVRREIEAADPDLVFLVQARDERHAGFEELAPVIEGRHVVSVPGNRHLAFGNAPLQLVKAVNHSRNARLTRMHVTLHGVDVDVLLVHLQVPMKRTDSLAFEELSAMVAELEAPALVLGDFNAPRSSRRLGEAMHGWQDASLVSDQRLLLSWRTPFMFWQIDHVFTRGLTPTHFEVLPSSASDHAALVVDLELPDPHRGGRDGREPVRVTRR